MGTILLSNIYVGVALSLLGFFIGDKVNKKLKTPLANPLLIGSIFVWVVLELLQVETAVYQQSNAFLHAILPPATVCLAVPMYEKVSVLRQNLAAILISVFAGVLSSIVSVFLFVLLINLNFVETIALLVRSITTPIALGITEPHGPEAVGLTALFIALTGISGNVMGVSLLKLFAIKHPIAMGLAFGTSSHVLGTTKALQLGAVQGAMSSLSIVVAGFMTVLILPLVETLLF